MKHASDGGPANIEHSGTALSAQVLACTGWNDAQLTQSPGLAQWVSAVQYLLAWLSHEELVLWAMHLAYHT